MVSRYLKFCLEHGLIRVVVKRRGRERYHFKDYDLARRGGSSSRSSRNKKHLNPKA